MFGDLQTSKGRMAMRPSTASSSNLLGRMSSDRLMESKKKAMASALQRAKESRGFPKGKSFPKAQDNLKGKRLEQ